MSERVHLLMWDAISELGYSLFFSLSFFLSLQKPINVLERRHMTQCVACCGS